MKCKSVLITRQLERNERLAGEISLLKSKLEVEQARQQEAQAALQQARAQAQQDARRLQHQCTALREELAELKRCPTPSLGLLTSCLSEAAAANGAAPGSFKTLGLGAGCCSIIMSEVAIRYVRTRYGRSSSQ